MDDTDQEILHRIAANAAMVELIASRFPITPRYPILPPRARMQLIAALDSLQMDIPLALMAVRRSDGANR